VLCARPRCSARVRRQATPRRETHRNFDFRVLSSSNFDRPLSFANHPHLFEVCFHRHRVPFREPGEAIAPVRKDECDTASPLRHELKNPQVCTLRALSTLWHLEANHNFSQIPQSLKSH
jgi:hypothetical protein